MIIKFKIFEEINDGKPQVGDYVICEEENFNKNPVKKYVNENIGKIIKIHSPNSILWFLIEYDIDFITCGFDIDKFQLEEDPIGCRNMNRDEIKYWSKDKEELESILSAKKYNL